MKKNYKFRKRINIPACLFFLLLLLSSCKKEAVNYTDIVTEGEMEAELTAPPLVPNRLVTDLQ